jgi:hypothetical protein
MRRNIREACGDIERGTARGRDFFIVSFFYSGREHFRKEGYYIMC